MWIEYEFKRQSFIISARNATNLFHPHFLNVLLELPVEREIKRSKCANAWTRPSLSGFTKFAFCSQLRHNLFIIYEITFIIMCYLYLIYSQALISFPCELNLNSQIRLRLKYKLETEEEFHYIFHILYYIFKIFIYFNINLFSSTFVMQEMFGISEWP